MPATSGRSSELAPHTHSTTRECVPPQDPGVGWDTHSLVGREWEEPIQKKGQTLWYSVCPLYTLHNQISEKFFFSVSQRDGAKQNHNTHNYNYNLFRVVRGREALAFANRYIKKVQKFSVLDCILYKRQTVGNSEKVTVCAECISIKIQRNFDILFEKKMPYFTVPLTSACSTCQREKV